MSNNDENDKSLGLLTINQILDKKFFISHYQRGYRWTSQQVEQLLDDIDAFVPKEIRGKPDEKTFYCLQPVVVKKMTEDQKQEHNLEGDWFEVIDGQQRLTTFYLIIHYINDLWAGRQKKQKFLINYETRDNCVQFLNNLRIKDDDSVVIDKTYIDYYHISKAYQTIRNWELEYENKKNRLLNDAEFQSKFFGYTKIIWYQVSQTEKSHELFERLNIGKIPLTNAELTKALFLSSTSFPDLSEEERNIKQFEIALLWNEIEQKLNEPDLKFWSFITNKKRETYDTRIELILDMISNKSEHKQDPLFTFLEFTKKQEKAELSTVWLEIEQFYATLFEWFKDKELNHKIGYLITAKPVSSVPKVIVRELVKTSMRMTKSDFHLFIDNKIRETVRCEISELRYKDHPNLIFNVLLLFNVETSRKSDAMIEFYPFKQHKDNLWSLEHIHARNSEGFDKTRKQPWIDWLEIHLKILREMNQSNLHGIEANETQNLINDIERYNTPQLTWERFASLFERTNEIFTIDRESMDRDSEGIANLALLSNPDNAKLNNSVFEIKRREIIRLDQEGHFVPVCTKRVFMKYYQEQGVDNKLIYWSTTDRSNYFERIRNVLEIYLEKKYIEENENEEFAAITQ